MHLSCKRSQPKPRQNEATKTWTVQIFWFYGRPARKKGGPVRVRQTIVWFAIQCTTVGVVKATPIQVFIVSIEFKMLAWSIFASAFKNYFVLLPILFWMCLRAIFISKDAWFRHGTCVHENGNLSSFWTHNTSKTPPIQLCTHVASVGILQTGLPHFANSWLKRHANIESSYPAFWIVVETFYSTH